ASLIPKRPPPRAGRDTLAPIMAAPEFRQPMYAPLWDLSQRYIMPGAEAVPQNSIAILQMNRRFIESFMAGLNHAFAGELRWREYPTDQRGTYCRQFWDSSRYANTDADRERLLDIARIHDWRAPLGRNSLIPAGPPI